MYSQTIKIKKPIRVIKTPTWLLIHKYMDRKSKNVLSFLYIFHQNPKVEDRLKSKNLYFLPSPIVFEKNVPLTLPYP